MLELMLPVCDVLDVFRDVTEVDRERVEAFELDRYEVRLLGKS